MLDDGFRAPSGGGCVRGILIVAAIGVSGASGCRGQVSAEPPVHLNQNMDQQRRFEAQEENPFFEDGRAMRPQVLGTVARGELHEDDHLYRGLVDGLYTEVLPLPVNRTMLLRGQSRFEIFCAPCHDRAGTGQGLVAQRGIKQGLVAPPDLHSDRVRAMPVGQLYETVTHGARDMPAYGQKLTVADRWATVAYIRVLQASRSVAISDVPADIAEQQGWRGAVMTSGQDAGARLAAGAAPGDAGTAPAAGDTRTP